MSRFLKIYTDIEFTTDREMLLRNPDPGPVNTDRSLLIADNDRTTLASLANAMEQLGFEVSCATTATEALDVIEAVPPSYLVTEMWFDDGNAIDVVEALLRRRPGARCVVLSGYGDFSTVCAVIRAGAYDYLSKPSTRAEDLYDVLTARPGAKPPPPRNPMCLKSVRWNHILRTHAKSNSNVSETARRLNMHRRTLQRIMVKQKVR